MTKLCEGGMTKTVCDDKDGVTRRWDAEAGRGRGGRYRAKNKNPTQFCWE